MGDNGTRGDSRAQSKQLAPNDRLQRLNEVIRVDSSVDPAELSSTREPLEPTCFGLIGSGELQRHVAILRVFGDWEAVLVAILHINCRSCRKSAHSDVKRSAAVGQRRAPNEPKHTNTGASPMNAISIIAP